MEEDLLQAREGLRARHRGLGWMVAILIVSALVSRPASSAIPSPTELWRWEGEVEAPLRPIPRTTPIVAQLTDDNLDGRIDADDRVDIAFLHTSESRTAHFREMSLTILDAATGAFHRRIDGDFGEPSLAQGGAMLAAADVDGDSEIDLVVSSTTEVIVFKADGTELLRRAWPRALLTPPDFVGMGLSLADVDGDGSVEVIGKGQVVSLGSGPTWVGSISASGGTNHSGWSQAVDLWPAEPGLEVLAGNVLYSKDGRVLWHASVPAGAMAAGDLDGDGDPEVVLVREGDLWVLDHLGSVLIGPEQVVQGLPSHRVPRASEPLLADVTGDGRTEIVVPAQTFLRCYSVQAGELVELWNTPIHDPTCCAGAFAHDLDGDGAADLLYHDEQEWLLIRGQDGAIIHSGVFTNLTGVERPVVADLDADCEAEVIFVGDGIGGDGAPHGGPRNAILAFDLPGAASAPPIHNQRAWHRTHVTDAGSIPQSEAAPWTSGSGWGLQSADPSCQTCDVQILAPATEPVCSRLGFGLGFEFIGPEPDAFELQWSSDCSEVRFHPDDRAASPLLFAESECLLDCELRLDIQLANGDSCSTTHALLLDGSGPPLIEGLPPDALLDCGSPIPPPTEVIVVDCDPSVSLAFAEQRIELACEANYDLVRTWVAEDRCGDRTQVQRILSVRDTSPPYVAESDALVACLWPPNHRMECFPAALLAPVIDDDCSEPVSWWVSGLTSDQPEDDLGDGRTPGDLWVRPDGSAFCVRAERQGGDKSGRIYRILVSAVDACGNESPAVPVGRIHVPHDHRDEAACRGAGRD